MAAIAHMTAVLATLALAIDWLFGEPKRYHPLVGFGRLAARAEALLRLETNERAHRQRSRGVAAWWLVVVPPSAMAAWLCSLPTIGPLCDVVALYFALGHRSLHDHARPILSALNTGDDAAARRCVGMMVSRDTDALHVEHAATESILENGNDGVFGALFWFAMAGGAGAVLYRLANTLDAMWGYRNDRYQCFGWAAARLDDALNYIPARLTAVTYAALGHTREALACWRTQAPVWDSPNAGPVMATGAGALGVRLGGPARYQGEWHERPILGTGDLPRATDIERALQLVRRGVYIWLCAFFVWGALYA